jgi:lysophospholipase L1-like esterase
MGIAGEDAAPPRLPRRRLLLGGLGAALVSLAGCGGGSKKSSVTGASTTQLDVGDNDPSRFTAFGDSLTLGTLKDVRVTPESYPVQLQRMLRGAGIPNARVLNRGVGGEHTWEGLARFADVLEADNPGFVLIMEGTNDPDDPSNVDNLRRMVRIAKGRQTIPLIATVPRYWDEGAFLNRAIEALNGGIRGIAVQEGIQLVDAYAALDQRDFFGGDGFHPNEIGYGVLAEAWLHGILSVLH